LACRPADEMSAGRFRCQRQERYTRSMANNTGLRTVPFGIIIGVAVGMALGIALKSIAIGIGVGSGLAVVFGLAVDRKRRGNS
jgi:hypothetical protein